MAAARARRPAEVGAERRIVEEDAEQPAQILVVDLAREVLEEAVELLDVPVRAREEVRRVALRLGGAPDVGDVDLELVAKPLDPPAHTHQVAAIEPTREEVR